MFYPRLFLTYPNLVSVMFFRYLMSKNKFSVCLFTNKLTWVEIVLMHSKNTLCAIANLHNIKTVIRPAIRNCILLYYKVRNYIATNISCILCFLSGRSISFPYRNIGYKWLEFKLALLSIIYAPRRVLNSVRVGV